MAELATLSASAALFRLVLEVKKSPHAHLSRYPTSKSGLFRFDNRTPLAPHFAHALLMSVALDLPNAIGSHLIDSLSRNKTIRAYVL